MSSANLVEITLIEEDVYGETPVAGDFATARFTSESLTGTPDTVESQQIRIDRMSSGQVVSGLTVGGDLQIEYAKEDVVDSFFKAAMQSDWAVSVPVAVELAIDTAAGTITRSAGDFNTDSRVGDFLKLTDFVNAVNNVEVTVAQIVSATVLKFVGPDTMIDETAAGASFQVADYLEIGVDQVSFTMQKRFIDLGEKAIIYKGQMVSDMEFNIAYGEIVKGSFSFSGNHYEPVKAAADFITDGRTILPPATSDSFNGSVDMPYVATESVGILDEATFCIQQLGIKLGNNLTTKNCIGKIAPEGYSLGTAQVEIDLSSYLSDNNWDFLAKKLTQESVAIASQIKNSYGWYGFFMPAMQLSFDDPASGGQNQEVTMAMSGQSKVGDGGESSLRIYRS